MNSQAELRRYFRLRVKGHECHFDAFLEAGRTAKNLLRPHEINFIGSVENQNVDPHYSIFTCLAALLSASLCDRVSD